MGELPSFSKDIREFITLLKKHDVRFLIVGGAAVIFHGYSRYTGDIDFFYDVNENNAKKLLLAIFEFWGGDPPGGLEIDFLMAEGQILQYGLPPHRIDLINRIDGVQFEEAWADRIDESLEIDGTKHRIGVMGKRTLLLNKAASGRDKDKDDLKNLRDL